MEKLEILGAEMRKLDLYPKKAVIPLSTRGRGRPGFREPARLWITRRTPPQESFPTPSLPETKAPEAAYQCPWLQFLPIDQTWNELAPE